MTVSVSSQLGKPTFATRRWSYRSLENEALRNEVINRLFIDIFGYQLWLGAFARNNFERLENVLGAVAFLGFGIAVPILVQKKLARLYEKYLAKRFKIKSPKGLLNTPFEQLDKAAITKLPEQRAFAKQWGVGTKRVMPLRHWVLAAKLAIIGVDMLFLMSQNLFYVWGRNALTEHLSKKQGFSGEFNVAVDTQLTKNNQGYQKNKKLMQKLSGISWGVGVFGLPALILGALHSKKTTGVMKALKKLTKAFNYHNTIYMSRWVMFWSTLFGFNIMTILGARSPNERREAITKAIMLDLLFYVGDTVFAGMAGKYFQNKYKEQLQGIRLYKKGWLGTPLERPLHQINADPKLKRLSKAARLVTEKTLDKLARWNFRIGIVTTSLLLGVGTILANNAFTRKRLRAQQAKMAEKALPLFQAPLADLRPRSW